MHHFHSYILQKTPLKLVNWFQRYEQLKDAKNNRKQKTFPVLFGSILKSIFPTSDWFCLITSHTYIEKKPNMCPMSKFWTVSEFFIVIMLCGTGLNPNLPDPLNCVPFGTMRYPIFAINLINFHEHNLHMIWICLFQNKALTFLFPMKYDMTKSRLWSFSDWLKYAIYGWCSSNWREEWRWVSSRIPEAVNPWV